MSLRHFSKVPVSPFVGACVCPAPPVDTLTTSDCLAGLSLDSRSNFRRWVHRLLLRPHSRTSGFESLRRQREAPDTTPAPEAHPALAAVGGWIGASAPHTIDAVVSINVEAALEKCSSSCRSRR